MALRVGATAGSQWGMKKTAIVYCPSGRHSLESTPRACAQQEQAWKAEGCSSCKAEKEKTS